VVFFHGISTHLLVDFFAAAVLLFVFLLNSAVSCITFVWRAQFSGPAHCRDYFQVAHIFARVNIMLSAGVLSISPTGIHFVLGTSDR